MKSNNPVVSQVIKDYTYSQRAFLPRELIIPLSQENESLYKSTVKVGDIVKEGDVIASCGENETTYIHAPLPGTITEFSTCTSPNGKKDECIKIKFSGAFTYLGKKHIEKDAVSEPSYTVIKKLIENGVVNTFKTSAPESLGLQIKEIVADRKVKRNLVVRMFDEDPYRITDSLMCKFYFDEIAKGAKVLASVLEAEGIVFAIDQKYTSKELFFKQEYAGIKGLDMNIKRYPCGTPREIVSAFVRGPLKKNCNFTLTKKDLFIDASTAYEVYKAAVLSIPSVDKYVHFSGDCLNVSCLLEVKVGTKLRDIVSQLGGFVKEPELIVVNGLQCGTSVHSLDVPITKYVKSVEFLSHNKKTDRQLHTCINCGNCRFACPTKLSPDILYNNTVKFKRLNERYAASVFACIECGLCNTVCPARLPLCQVITLLKNNLSSE